MPSLNLPAPRQKQKSTLASDIRGGIMNAAQLYNAQRSYDQNQQQLGLEKEKLDWSKGQTDIQGKRVDRELDLQQQRIGLDERRVKVAENEAKVKSAVTQPLTNDQVSMAVAGFNNFDKTNKLGNAGLEKALSPLTEFMNRNAGASKMDVYVGAKQLISSPVMKQQISENLQVAMNKAVADQNTQAQKTIGQYIKMLDKGVLVDRHMPICAGYYDQQVQKAQQTKTVQGIDESGNISLETVPVTLGKQKTGLKPIGSAGQQRLTEKQLRDAETSVLLNADNAGVRPQADYFNLQNNKGYFLIPDKDGANFQKFALPDEAKKLGWTPELIRSMAKDSNLTVIDALRQWGIAQ